MKYLQRILKKSKPPITSAHPVQEKLRKNKDLGDFGEAMAERHLKEAGFEVLDRNVLYKCGEIDIVARRAGQIHFVEVKTRSSSRFGSPFEAITERKKARMRRAAQLYLLKSRKRFKDIDNYPCYFSVIGITYKQGEPIVDCILNAFE